MTVTLSDYHLAPGPSYGKVTLSKVDDTVAFDFDNSRQYTVQSHYGYFDVKYSLIDQPDEDDWWEFQSMGITRIGQEINVGGKRWSRNTIPINSSDRVVYGVSKWIRFTLKSGDVAEGTAHKAPAIQFRNIKNTRVVISGESELTVRSTAPTSLDIPYSTRMLILYDRLNRVWFDGDHLTRYTATSSDENVVVASLVRRDVLPGSGYERPYQISLRTTGAVHTSADVTVTAMDAANNRASHTVAVNVTNRTQTPGS